MTAAARGVVGVRLAEEASIGSALADDAIAFRAACTIAAEAYELLLFSFSALPAHEPMKTVNQHVYPSRSKQRCATKTL